MKRLIWFVRLLPLLGLLLWQLAAGSGMAAAAQPPQADQVSWLNLNVLPVQIDQPTSAFQFSADVSYQLTSAQAGELILFVFPNSTQTSSVHGAPVPVSGGAGRETLTMAYQPQAGDQTLTLFAGLFTDKQALLSWTATDPVALSDWQSKAAFVGAMQAQQTGDYTTSVTDLNAAISLSPKNSQLYYWRGDAESHLGLYDAAIADYGKALTLTPNDRASELGQGVAYLWKGDEQQAINDLTQVVQAGGPADQVTAWAYRALGTAYTTLNQPSQAIANYEQYLALAPQATDREAVNNWISQLQAISQAT